MNFTGKITVESTWDELERRHDHYTYEGGICPVDFDVLCQSYGLLPRAGDTLQMGNLDLRVIGFDYHCRHALVVQDSWRGWILWALYRLSRLRRLYS